MGINVAQTSKLKVVILAAAQGECSEIEYPRALQRLGDRAIIDHVLELAHHFASPKDIYIIVGYRHQAIEDYLGPEYTYVLQDEPLGTGHAVLQMQPLLQDYDGELLILYGDTPLFRLSSLRGMLLRHRLKNADFTLFSIITDVPLPYGRVVRDNMGRVVNIVEEANANAEIRGIRELNVGAYVAKARPLFQALARHDRKTDLNGHLLTDTVRRLIAMGHQVACYQSSDPDEIIGIDTPADLEMAELILQKRILRPRRIEEESIIQFGTGGWRAVIGEGFTMHNVRRLCQALANRLIRQDLDRQGVLIGYDRRFLSDSAAEAAAEVFAGNNVPVALLSEAAPTPLITYATVLEGAAYGLGFTASHNPPEWNGLKVFKEDGALLLDEETREIEAEANALTADDIVKIELPLAVESGLVTYKDYTNEYVDAVESFVDMAAIRKAGLRVLVDPMFGTGEATINIVLTEARCRVVTIHGRRDPLFGGRSPAPNLEALGLLIHYIKEEGNYDLGLATDGDADRIAIVDEQGEYIAVNDLLVLLYWYLYEVRGEKGPVVRNLATTHMLDRLARSFGERCIEVPVGFKHIAAAMKANQAILGGESSGGLTIRGHILGKDGILSAALVVEMLAKTGEKVSHLLEQVYGQIGRLYMRELNLPATPEMKALFPRHLSQNKVEEIAGLPVRGISGMDGTKFLLDGDQWVLLRFSGTEPLLRIFAEADSPARADALIQAAQKLLPM
jgi:phosphomannomutase